MKNRIPKFLAGDTVIVSGVRRRLKVIQRTANKQYLLNDGNKYKESDLRSPFDPRE